MNTWRETILEAVKNRLISADVASGNVYRSRVEAFRRDELPAVIVKPGPERVENTSRGIAMRRFGIHIEVHARGNPAESYADVVLAAAHSALMADQTLGDVIVRLLEEETLEPSYADGDEAAISIITTYVAIYPTPTDNNTRIL